MDWRKRKSSQVWDYFDHIAPCRVKCRICATELSYLNRSTSSLYRHFRALHDRDPLSATVSKATSRKQAMDQAVINMVSKDWPLSIVEDECFRELLHLLEPNYVVPTTKALRNMMGQVEEEEDEEMTESDIANGIRHVKVENLLAPLEFSPPDSPVLFLKQEPLDEEEFEAAMMEGRSADKPEKAVPAEESRNPRVRQHQQFLATYRRKDKGSAPGTAKQRGDGLAETPQFESESIVPSDVDSDSLLAPVRTRDGFQGRSASQVGSMEAENGVSSQEPRSRGQSRFNDSIDMPEYYRYAGAGLFSSPVSPTPFESSGGGSSGSSGGTAIMDAASFWRSCNTAGCTEDFFGDLVSQMTRLSERIRAEQASQEDYDVAMKVMEASGRLALLVGKKQKELEEQQAQLQRAQVAMKTLASAVKR